MIVSASYRTDIPAFYADWFQRRLEAGYADVRNPYGGSDYRVDLRPQSVDGFVFWTRNLARFAQPLAEVHRLGIPFVVQMTITGYPRALETSVVEPARAIEQLHGFARTYGPRAAVWRYDPIVDTELTPPDWHRETFAKLAAELAGATDEVVVSWATVYRKTARNLAAAARAISFEWSDPPDEDKRALLADLATIADQYGMTTTLCTQPHLLAPAYPPHPNPLPPGEREPERTGSSPLPWREREGPVAQRWEGEGDNGLSLISPARCIDVERLSDIAGRPIVAKAKGNRPGCECARSRDIGAYDTCPHGCVYCYAVQNRALAQRRHKAHDPGKASLTAEPGTTRPSPGRQSDLLGNRV